VDEFLKTFDFSQSFKKRFFIINGKFGDNIAVFDPRLNPIPLFFINDMFSRFGAPILEEGKQAQAVGAVPSGDFGKVQSAYQLQTAIRTYGHLAADIYPLNDRPKDSSRLQLSNYGLTENDLQQMPASLFFNNIPATVENGLDAINYLKSVYTGKIAFEYRPQRD